ncbi:PH domain-containing protein [Demequina iriomotensis]|uniref:PH domain-containing protein n=1 Tax=Demequina iriomotensis TaxID=1536641 RepID=UPI0007837EE3|nr:PH domain-containing protein [Demequina iriomotensis]
MIDFQNPSFIKLSRVDPANADGQFASLLLDGEQIMMAFRGMRDMVVFTTKRIIALNVQGMTGKKKDFTSLPYNRIQAFSVETAGTFDRDAELEVYFSALGKVKFEFAGSTDVAYLAKLIGHYVL